MLLNFDLVWNIIRFLFPFKLYSLENSKAVRRSMDKFMLTLRFHARKSELGQPTESGKTENRVAVPWSGFPKYGKYVSSLDTLHWCKVTITSDTRVADIKHFLVSRKGVVVGRALWPDWNIAMSILIFKLILWTCGSVSIIVIKTNEIWYWNQK